MTPDRIAELRALTEAATPGPWFARSLIPEDCANVAVDENPINPEYLVEDGTLRPRDAAFIAAARTALPEALDALERVRALADSIRVVKVKSYVDIVEATEMVQMMKRDILAALEGKP